MIYGKYPVFLGDFDISLPEVMYYLYLPVIMREKDDFLRLPPALSCCEPLIAASLKYATKYQYVYVSARKGWATPDNPLNRPGWHCDGFGTNDVNMVWWDGPGTRFAVQVFEGICSDHNRSMKQFDEQVLDECIKTYRQHGLYAIHPDVVHATPIIEPPGCMRQYIKISMSNSRYNLENNSHNWQFDYQWPLHPRTVLRNDPARAQLDYYDGGA